MEEYMTLQEVQKITKISIFSLRKKIREGELKATKKCNKYLVLREDLQKFMDTGKNI